MPTIPPRRTTGSSGKWPAIMWRPSVFKSRQKTTDPNWCTSARQEVFQAGDIPVCPHLMFPPIADPGDPVQDQAAREMGLRLVEKCQQVNVYGPVTEGMWAEIHRANKLDIPVVTNLKTKGRTSPRRKKSAKREEVK